MSSSDLDGNSLGEGSQQQQEDGDLYGNSHGEESQQQQEDDTQKEDAPKIIVPTPEVKSWRACAINESFTVRGGMSDRIQVMPSERHPQTKDRYVKLLKSDKPFRQLVGGNRDYACMKSSRLLEDLQSKCEDAFWTADAKNAKDEDSPAKDANAKDDLMGSFMNGAEPASVHGDGPPAAKKVRTRRKLPVGSSLLLSVEMKHWHYAPDDVPLRTIKIWAERSTGGKVQWRLLDKDVCWALLYMRLEIEAGGLTQDAIGPDAPQKPYVRYNWNTRKYDLIIAGVGVRSLGASDVTLEHCNLDALSFSAASTAERRAIACKFLTSLSVCP